MRDKSLAGSDLFPDLSSPSIEFAGAQPGERQRKSKGQTLLQQLREKSQSCRDEAGCSSPWRAVAGQRLTHLRHSVAQSLLCHQETDCSLKELRFLL